MTEYRSDLIDLAVEVIGETEKAWRVTDGDKTVWVPKSQCEVEKTRGNHGTLTCPEWLAMDKGLI